MISSRIALTLLIGALTGTAIGCAREPSVSFSTQVKPILDENCQGCHSAGGVGTEASGFSMESYEDLMRGTRNGPMVIANDPLGSNLLVLMEGRADPSIRMPHGDNPPVARADIEIIRAWIEQGAPNN